METFMLAQASEPLHEVVMFYGGWFCMAVALIGSYGMLRPGRTRWLALILPGKAATLIGATPRGRLSVRIKQWCILGWVTFVGTLLLRWVPLNATTGQWLAATTIAVLIITWITPEPNDHELALDR